MTLDQLRYFSAAAAFQHVGKAANSIPISASVISAAIISLREEIGVDLFKRVGRNIELTAAGNKLYRQAKAILQEVDQLKEIVTNESIALEGKYRLGASHFLSSRHLCFAWSKMTKEHPKLTADLYSMNSNFAVNDLLAGRLDLALCFSPIQHPDLVEKVVARGYLQFAVRKGHPVLKRPAKERHQFLNSSAAIIHKSSHLVETCESHPVFHKLGISPKIRLSFDSDDIAITSLKHSDAWSFIPDIVVEANKNSLQVVPFPKGIDLAPYHVSALIHRHRHKDPVLLQLVERLCLA